MATEEITISELELAGEVLADMTLPVDTATETRAVTLKQLQAWLGSSLPTGFIIPAVGKISDERFTLLDGKTLSRAGTYEAFCNKVVSEVKAGNWFACSEDEYAQDLSDFGQCGKFVVSNNYIRIPTITRFIGATITLSEIGKTYKESLPQHTHTRGTMNITGNMGTTGSYGTNFVSGAFYNASGINIDSANAGNANKPRINFDASRNWTGATSNASGETYQNNAKVQPDHTKYPYYMVISTEGQTANVEIDINKVYEDLNLKANSDLSNVSANIDYVVERYNEGTNWYRVYKSGWIEQGGVLKNRTEGVKTFNLLKPFANTNYTGKAGICTASAMEVKYSDCTYGISGFAPVSTSQACVRTIPWSDSSWVAYGQGA